MTKGNSIAAPNRIFYFLGNLPSQVLTSAAVVRELPGEFIVLSDEARQYCEKQHYPVRMMDRYTPKRLPFRSPDILNYSRFDFSEIPNTLSYLNRQKGIIFFFDTFTGLPKLKTLVKIMLFHGNSLKTRWFRPWRLAALNHFDYMTTLGPFWENKLRNGGVRADKFLQIGQSRCDEIIQQANGSPIRAHIDALTGTQGLPILTYMPTWYGTTSVRDVGKEIIRNISDDFILLFRPHPETPASLIREYEVLIEKKKKRPLCTGGAI